MPHYFGLFEKFYVGDCQVSSLCCSVREVYSSVSYTKYLGAQSMFVRGLLKHGGLDSSLYYLRAIILFHRFKYDVGTRHLATRIKFKSQPIEQWHQ